MAGVRIASLIPSGTDLVIALGLGGHLVGVSHECDHEEARGLPVLTSSVIPPPALDGPSIEPAEIDRIVSASVQAGSSLYLTDRALLRSLAPDVIVTQDVCDVCAVNADAARDLMCELAPGAKLVMLRATDVAGFFRDLSVLGDALGVAERAASVVAFTAAALQEHRSYSQATEGKRVDLLTLEWSDPPFLGGHWVPELVELAGALHVISGPGEASRRSDWDEIAAADPDVIVFCPCGYDLHQATVEATALAGRPEVASLRAVRSGRFYAVDANRLFSRCTTNLVEAVAVLRSLAGADADTQLPTGTARVAHTHGLVPAIGSVP